MPKAFLYAGSSKTAPANIKQNSGLTTNSSRKSKSMSRSFTKIRGDHLQIVFFNFAKKINSRSNIHHQEHWRLTRVLA